MAWTLDFTIKTRRHLVSLQRAVGLVRRGVERFPDGARRIHAGLLEIHTAPRRG